LSDTVLTDVAEKRFAELGINVKRLRECLGRVCADKVRERPSGLVYKQFDMDRREQAKATPTLSFKKPGAPKQLTRPAETARPVNPATHPATKSGTRFVTTFLRVEDDVMKRGGGMGGMTQPTQEKPAKAPPHARFATPFLRIEDDLVGTETRPRAKGRAAGKRPKK
jgi:hypothetical protein